MDKWIEGIDQVSKDVRESFGDLNELELNFKLDRKNWSIAQHLEHLIIINESYFPLFEEIRSGQMKLSWIGGMRPIANFMGKAILKSVNPDNARKTKTFGIWQPSQNKISNDIVDRFVSHQEELKKWYDKAAPWILKDIIVHSPANRNVTYPISRAFEIILDHERRHLKHARGINPKQNEAREFRS